MRFLVFWMALAGCAGVSSDPGRGQLVAHTDRWAGALVERGDELYFVHGAATPYEVRHVAKTGGTSTQIATGAVITSLTSDTHGIYWLQNDQGTTTVRAWSPGDAESRTLGTNPTWANGSSYRNMVSDDVALYYSDGTGAIWRVPLSGAGQTMLGMTTTSAGAVTLSPGVLWVSTLTGVMRIPLAGGAATEMTLGADRPDQLAWDDNQLFVLYGGSGFDDGYINRVDAEGSVSTVATHLVLPTSLIASQGDLYFTTGNNDAAVRRVPYGGGPTDALAVGQLPAALALDDRYVYWTDLLSGELRKTPR